MRLLAHFIVSFVLALAIYPFFGSYSFLVLVSGFLIDVDHYLYYLLSGRGWNPFEANDFFIKVKSYNILCVFHTIELFLAVVVYAFFSRYGVILLVGLVVHHMMDLYSEYVLDRMDSKSKSIVWYLIKRSKL